MGLFSDLGLGAARRMRTRLGARGALRVLSPMIAASPPSPARAAAILVGLECAIELDDDLTFEALALGWGAEREGARTADAARLCAMLIAAGRAERAAALATAEVERRDRRASRALRAVAREASGASDGAVEDWRVVVAEADRVGDRAMARAARIELSRLLVSQPGRRLEAARVASDVDEEPSTGRAQLALAIARLAENGRYARVRGLDALVALSRDPDATLARAAIRAACAHVDDSGAALTSVELERVRCAVLSWPDERERARLIGTLETIAETIGGDAATQSAALVRAAIASEDARAQLARARAVLSGDAPGPRPVGENGAWSALAAIAAMRRGRTDEARDRLRELAQSQTGETSARSGGTFRPRGALPSGPSGASTPVDAADGSPAAWTAAWMALDRASTRDGAVSLVSVLLLTRSTPPRGFLALADHLERAGADALARAALTRAQEQREPGARERRVDALLRAAWTAHREGRRDDALRWLRDARE